MPLELASDEEMLVAQINSLARKILSYSSRRDVLIGKAVALETRGMGYDLRKAFSLGMRWYSCKDLESFKAGYKGSADSGFSQNL